MKFEDIVLYHAVANVAVFLVLRILGVILLYRDWKSIQDIEKVSASPFSILSSMSIYYLWFRINNKGLDKAYGKWKKAWYPGYIDTYPELKIRLSFNDHYLIALVILPATFICATSLLTTGLHLILYHFTFITLLLLLGFALVFMLIALLSKHFSKHFNYKKD